MISFSGALPAELVSASPADVVRIRKPIHSDLDPKGSEDNESGVARDLITISEQTIEFRLIAEVAIANNPKFAAPPQHITRLCKHLQCHGIRDGVICVKGRVIKDAVDSAL